MNTIVFLSVFLFGCAMAGVLTPNKDFSYLSDTVGKTLEVDVDFCTNAPCRIKRGTPTFTRIRCYSDILHSKLEIKTLGTNLGITVNQPPSEKDACKIGANCFESSVSHNITYDSTVPTSQIKPPLNSAVYAEWQMIDSDTRKIVCGYKLTTYID